MGAHSHVFWGTRSESPFCYPFSLAPPFPVFPKIRLPPLGLISSVVHPASVPVAGHYFHLWNSFPSLGTGSRSRAPAGVASLGRQKGSVFALQH